MSWYVVFLRKISVIILMRAIERVKFFFLFFLDYVKKSNCWKNFTMSATLLRDYVISVDSTRNRFLSTTTVLSDRNGDVFTSPLTEDNTKHKKLKMRLEDGTRSSWFYLLVSAGVRLGNPTDVIYGQCIFIGFTFRVEARSAANITDVYRMNSI